MAQMQRPQRSLSASKAPPQTIRTMEQLLREGSKLSPTHSPAYLASSSSANSYHFTRSKNHDVEEGQNHKKSVLTKVKEKAKKLRHSLSKKKHDYGNTSSPSWGGFEDDGVEENAEYYGAPMYESDKIHEGYIENANQHSRGSPVIPEGYRENARLQHPRGGPLISEKHVLSSYAKDELEQDRDKLIGRNMSKKTAQPSAAATKTAAAAATSLPGANKNLAEKLIPSNVEGSSEAAHSIASKIQGLSVSKTSEHHNPSSSSSTTAANPNKTSLSNIAAPKPLVRMHSTVSSSGLRTPAGPMTPVALPSSAPAGSKNTNPTSQLWDKAVSVKDYLMNKFEPGEDEKALSQVISEAVSPRRTPGDVGVMEKVREAVTSLLRTDEPKKHADTTITTRNSSQTPVQTNNTTRASSHIPGSTNNTTHAPLQIPLSSNNTTHASSQTPMSTNNTARASSKAPESTNISTARASSQGSVSTNNSAHAASQYPISTYLRTTRSSSQNPSQTRNTTRASSQLPVSTNAKEVAQEENHGRILQAN
ncbi:PREDICTED: flocculation protein FLO11-like isoform X2 [Lupinus angustifolius]|uniref:flocculation protein FLO11-like isoform X2 n=1 Tax=Lupinus angustifolius TaxID=3871 RepID=UPI00092EF9BD|nr:PREDICTED: flocculation protein FLO11-like isoform X2 [Lupinus angustifolius]